ncbi:MAG: bacterial Ig-like domain-containing protein [Bacteroidaceae bacterium]|nr:bacterial Ig-like domain-containing protein [Bacteroidaceae bacterium]
MFTKKLNWLIMSMMLMVSGSAWAQDPAVLWEEDFSTFANGDVPSGGIYSYICTDGGTQTKIYDLTYAGGESPELLVSKNGGTFTATIPLDNVEGDLTLTFKTNQQSIKVSTSTEGISGGLEEKVAGTHTCTFTGVTTSMTEIVITFTGNGSSNVRLDDIVLIKGTIPVATKTLTSIALSGTYPTTFQQGDAFSHDGMTVTATYDDESTANVTSKAIFTGYDMSTVGEQTVSVTYTEGEVSTAATYTITVNEKAPVTIEDGVFDFTKGNDYGTGLNPKNDNSYIEEDYTWKAGNVTLVTSGKYRWWSTDGTLRVYAPSSGNTTLTLSVPNGYVITEIVIDGNSNCASLTANTGNYSTSDGYVWTGKSQTVVISRGSANAQIKSISVTYEEGTSDPIKVDIATINSLSPTEVDAGSDGTFTVDVTLADGITEEDYGISFTSSDENVISVDANSGEYIVGDESGTVTITVRVDALDEETYNNVEKQFTITVTAPIDPNAPGASAENPYTVAQARAAIDAGTGTTGVYATGIVSKIVTAYNSQFGNISYNISADGSTSGDQLQAYRGKSFNGENFTSADDIQVGDVVVIYGNLKKYNSTYEFDQDNQLVSLDRPVKKIDIATINSLSPTEVEVGSEGTFEVDVTLADGLTEEDYEISFTSDNTDVLDVDDSGAYLAYTAGTVTITVRVDALDEETYNNVEKQFTVTVKDVPTPVADVIYTKVTSKDEITDGQYLIVYEEGSVAFDGSLAKLDAVGNTIDVEINGNTITGTSETVAAEFTINVTEGSLMSASGYYVGQSSYANGLVQSSENIYKNSFSIDTSAEGVTSAAINLNVEGGTLTMKYNKASNQNRFRYYKTGQQAIQLYKKQDASNLETIKVGPAGYATYVTKNAVEFNGVKAYAVTAINEKSVSLQELTSAPAGTPVVVEAEEGEYPCTIIESAEAPEKNELAYSKEDVVSDGTFYALANKPEADGVGFYPVKSGVTIPAGKAYLEVGAEVKGFLALGDVADAINDILVETANGNIFNIAGQKVQNITKGGLYIVNGKKVIVK